MPRTIGAGFVVFPVAVSTSCIVYSKDKTENGSDIKPKTSRTNLTTTHYMYIRQHEPNHADNERSDTARCLFVTNVPVDATAAHFRGLFAQETLGGVRVENVHFSDDPHMPPSQSLASSSKKRKRSPTDAETDADTLISNLPTNWTRTLHRSGSTAIIQFVDRTSASTALRAVKKILSSSRPVTPLWPSGELQDKIPALGRVRYQTHHSLRFPTREALQLAVDTYMAAYDAKTQTRSRAAARAAQVPDADGFITVTKGARVAGAGVGPTSAASSALAEEMKERRKRKERKEAEKREGLADFYRFQVRARKKEEAGGLVRKFQEDRARAAKLFGKGRRRFRPD